VTLADLEAHNCLAADTIEVWRLEGPGGDTHVHPHGNVRSNCGEFVRELVMSGVGLGLLSTWDIGPALRSGSLRVVLPEFRGASNAAVHAVYPSREFMPAKVNVLIEFLAELYGPQPYWDKDLDLDKMSSTRLAARSVSSRVKAASPAVASR
jgi:DNA-binding transcriptional LysR family regulator